MGDQTTSGLDFTKVLSRLSGKQLLMGILLFVVQVVLLTWFGVAQTSIERIVAGSLMTLILLVVLFSLGRLANVPAEAPAPPPGLPNLQPAPSQVTKQEVEAPPQDTIAGPDRSYLIQRPPDDWVVEEMTMEEWVAQQQGISGRKAAQAGVDGKRDIFLFRSSRRMSVVPVPGQTKIDGRALPTALEYPVDLKLSVIPMERAQPPLFIPRTLENNFISVVGTAASAQPMRLAELSNRSLPGSGLASWYAQFEQHVEDAIINGKTGSVEIYAVYIGIEGEIRDYLVVMNYGIQTQSTPEQKRDLNTLQSLANSFRPVKTVNPAQKREEMRLEADQNFSQYVKQNGRTYFMTEFRLLLQRLQELNWDDPADRLRGMDMAAPFERLAVVVGIKGSPWDEFWSSLHEAQKGDATNFRQMVAGAAVWWPDAVAKLNAELWGGGQALQASQQSA